MTEEEIRRDWRLAKYPDDQIHVLADLNRTTPKVIRGIIEGGVWSDFIKKKPTPAQSKAWTSAEIECVAKMRRELCTFAQIGAALGRTPGAVHNLVVRMPDRFPTRQKYRVFSAEDDRTLREMWAKGESLSEIGRALGRTPTTIRIYLRRKGLYPRSEKERAAHDTAIS